MRGRRNTTWLGTLVAVFAAGLVAAPAASAQVLLEERAETEAEQYAYEVAGGSSGFLPAQLPEGEVNLSVTRTDAGKCRRRTDLVRVCPVVYEGKDYAQESCKDAPLVQEETPSENTPECFDTVVCRQTVVVTLRVVGTARNISLRASPMRCQRAGQNTSATP